MATVDIKPLNYTILSNVPKFDVRYPKPCYYFDTVSNKHYFVISTVYRQNEAGVYLYDIESNIYNKIASYPNDFKPYNHKHAINDKNELYVLSGAHKVYGILNLQTKEWIIKDRMANHGAFMVYAYFVPHPCSKMFMFSDSTNDKSTSQWEVGSNSLIPLKGLNIGSSHNPRNIVYVKCKNQLILITETLWYTNVIDTDCNEFEWINMNIETPKKESGKQILFRIVLAFDWIIFAFDRKGSIWCLDLLIMKWFESQYLIPTEWWKNRSAKLVVNPNTNELHLISCGYKSKNDDIYHYKISLNQFIPQQIAKNHQQRFVSLVFGYVHCIENQLFHDIIISNNLIKLILKFYHSFL